MTKRERLARLKRATVALAIMPEQAPSDRRETPFRIVGSGFCIHPEGIVVTCEHVLSEFFGQDVRKMIDEIPEEDRKGGEWPLSGIQWRRPHVIFYDFERAENGFVVFPVQVTESVAKLDYDLGLVRLEPHGAFERGYPHLEVEDYTRVFEGMDVTTCGFPLGTDLHKVMGTRPSSFSQGILSSIAPAPGTAPEHLTGFQLDITSTFGNSGGPIVASDTGQVIGFVQGGPKAMPAMVFGEPIYRPIVDGTLERFRKRQLPDPATQDRAARGPLE